MVLNRAKHHTWYVAALNGFITWFYSLYLHILIVLIVDIGFFVPVLKKKEELVRLAIIHKNYSPRQIDKIFGTK